MNKINLKKAATDRPKVEIEFVNAVAIYVRVTRDESLHKGLSIPGQIRDGLNYIKRQFGVDEKDVIVIEEESAVGGDVPFDKRPAGCRLIAGVRSGKYSVVVVRQIDRLARSPEVWNEFQTLCIEKEVQVHSFAGPIRFTEPNDKFTTGIQVLAAQLEKEQTGDRVRRSKKQMAMQGRHKGGPPPFGYTSQARHKRELLDAGYSEEDAKRLAEEKYPRAGFLYIDEKEAEIVRLIFHLYVAENLGCRDVAKNLNSQGFKRRTQLNWVPQKVLKRINDPVVTGHITHDDERYERGGRGKETPKHLQELFQGQHEAIVTLETWREAQVIKGSRVSARTGRGDSSVANRRYPLSGVLECRCGRKMKATSQWKSRTTEYGDYCCYKRRDFGSDVECGGCNFPRMRIGKADEAFWTAAKELLSGPELVNQVYREALKIRDLRESQDHHGPTLHDRLAKVITSLDFYHHKDSESKEEFEKELIFDRLKRLAKEKKELEEAIKSEESKPASNELVVSRDDIEKYFAGFAKAISKSKDRGCGLVGVLQEHHGLRVRLVDAETLAVSLRFRPPGAAEEESVDAFVPVETIVRLPKNHIDQWIEKHQGKVKCKICGDDIKVLRRHHSQGLPEHHKECWASELTKRRSNPDRSKFYNGNQAAKVLGISRTQFGRWIKRGMVIPLGKPKGVLLFNKNSIDEMRNENGQRKSE